MTELASCVDDDGANQLRVGVGAGDVDGGGGCGVRRSDLKVRRRLPRRTSVIGFGRFRVREARYRRMQTSVYNFLERPKDCKSYVYHIFVFFLVCGSLLLSVLSTIEGYEDVSKAILYHAELVMLVWFSLEFAGRVWSAGCRSRYQLLMGRLLFMRRPLCIVDLAVMLSGIIVLCLEGSGQLIATSTLRGLRFIQILRLVRFDRRGGSWRLLGSVVWIHRQELMSTLYIGFLGLIFSSLFVYLAEKEKNANDFKTYADAIWWGVVTLCTVGYGDAVPITWPGKLIAACCAIMGISFFALPAGILGSGFALKVQEQQRQKHLIRRRVPAATLIQSVWRCYAADKSSRSTATWKIHIHRSHPLQRSSSSIETHKPFSSSSSTSSSRIQRNNGSFMNRLRIQRQGRISRNGSIDEQDRESVAYPLLSDGLPSRPLLARRITIFKDSEGDDGVGEERMEKVTQLTEAHKDAIRGLRKIKYFVARRKFKEALKPYDVKDVIEQYSAGHVDMLSRVKTLQSRLDLLTGFSSSVNPVTSTASTKRASVDLGEGGGGGVGVGGGPDARLCLPMRLTKLERRMDDIKDRLDLLLQSFADDRQRSMIPLRIQPTLRRIGLGGQSSFGDYLPTSPDAPPSTPTSQYGPRLFGRVLPLGSLHPDLLPRVSEGEIMKGIDQGFDGRRKMRRCASDPGHRTCKSNQQMV